MPDPRPRRRSPARAASAAALLALALAGCGEKGALRATSTQPKPPIPFGRDRGLSTDAVLTPPPQAAPERSVELHIRSEPRADDPFDLPPGE